MSSDPQSELIQCPSCNARLRAGRKAIGKTIACPKCGQHIKLPDVAQTARPLVVARPITDQATPARASENSLASSSGWENMQFPVASGAYSPATARTHVAAKKSNKWLWISLAAIGAALLLVVSVTVIVLMSTSGSRASSDGQTALSSGTASSGKPAVNTQRFPELGMQMPFSASADFHRVVIPRSGQKSLALNIFIPKGEHANQSLPVMFESPSGTNLLHGATVEMPMVSTEYLPFTEAGMITITFSLDGHMPPSVSPDSGARYVRELQRAFKEFVAADAGVDNGKLAIDYTLAKIPAADPKRLYVWGHSSAATAALLLASKDARISKCVAMAPVTNLSVRLGELLSDSSMKRSFPNLQDYLKSGSPLTYVQQLKCPVYIGHAEDDDNEPFSSTRAYVTALQQAGGNVRFDARKSGGHYQELLNASVPGAVAWLKGE